LNKEGRNTYRSEIKMFVNAFCRILHVIGIDVNLLQM